METPQGTLGGVSRSIETEKTYQSPEKCWAKSILFNHGVLHLPFSPSSGAVHENGMEHVDPNPLKKWNSSIAKLSVRLADIGCKQTTNILCPVVLEGSKWEYLAKEYIGLDVSGARSLMNLFNTYISSFTAPGFVLPQTGKYQVDARLLSEFVLFVWVQFYPTFVATIKHHSEYTDHWPASEERNKVEDSEMEEHTATNHIASVEQIMNNGPEYQMHFVRSNLATIVQTLFVLTKQAHRSDSIPRNLLRSLSILIECENGVALSNVDFGTNTDGTENVSFQLFHKWVSTRMCSYTPCTGSQPLKHHSEKRIAGEYYPPKHLGEAGTVVTQPEELCTPTSRCLLFANLENETIVFDPSERQKEGNQVLELRFEGCKGCYIYVLQPVSFLHAVGCSDCTIVPGPVSGVASFELCDSLYVVVPGNQILIKNCLDSTFMMYAICAPILVGDCRGVVLGPYNTMYPWLYSHLADSGVFKFSPKGLVERPNAWDGPQNIIDDAEGLTQVRLMTPEEYRPFAIPVQPPMRVKEGHRVCNINPFPLPKRFAASAQRMLQETSQILSILDGPETEENNSMNEVNKLQNNSSFSFLETKEQPTSRGEEELDDKQLLCSMVKGAFRDWLVHSGKYSELDGLAKLASTEPAKLLEPHIE